MNRIPFRASTALMSALALAGAFIASGALAFWLMPGRGAAPAFERTPANERVGDAFAGLSLSFVPNAGQTDARVRYYARQSKEQVCGSSLTREAGMAGKDKGGSKNSKTAASKTLKEKREAKRAKADRFGSAPSPWRS